jgi:hypothetical protein
MGPWGTVETFMKSNGAIAQARVVVAVMGMTSDYSLLL